MVDRCHECGSPVFEAKVVRVIFDLGSHIKIVDRVPAEVCTQCGEKYFLPSVTQALTASRDAPLDAFVLVPVKHLT